MAVEIKIAEKLEWHGPIRSRVYLYWEGKMVLAGEATLVPPAS